MINDQCSQAATERTITTRPVEADVSRPLTRPEFIRLPKPGTLCPYTGLSRSKLNEIVLPSLLNNFQPPVKSISLRNRGQIKAVRLIVFDSLITYLRTFMQEGGAS